MVAENTGIFLKTTRENAIANKYNSVNGFSPMFLSNVTSSAAGFLSGVGWLMGGVQCRPK